MKIGIVSSDEIEEAIELRLDATFYVDPAWKINEEIARCEKYINRAQTRLENLKSKKAKLLEGRRLV